MSQFTSSTVGLKNLVFAQLLRDEPNDDPPWCSYGMIQYAAGAIEASITREYGNAIHQYGDDHRCFTVIPSGTEITLRTKLADLPLSLQETLFGSRIDEDGVLYRRDEDEAPFFAVGFKAQKSNGFYRYVWLFKVRARLISENYGTKEGFTINRQTPEVEWIPVRRECDGMMQAVADEDQNGFTPAMGAQFLRSVPTPKFSADIYRMALLNFVQMEPDFDPNITEYTATVAYTTVRLEVITRDAHAKLHVTLDGETLHVINLTMAVAVYEFRAPIGNSTLKIRVTNNGCVKTYSFALTRPY